MGQPSIASFTVCGKCDSSCRRVRLSKVDEGSQVFVRSATRNFAPSGDNPPRTRLLLQRFQSMRDGFRSTIANISYRIQVPCQRLQRSHG